MPQYHYIGKEKEPAKKTPDNRALILAAVLVLIVIGFFLGKVYIDSKKNQSLEKRITEEQETDPSSIEVELATPEQAFKAVRSKQAQLIDIREEGEFNLKHIESSLNLPLSSIQENIEAISQKKIVYIIDREESLEGRILVQHLVDQGVNAKYLKGGILAYAQEGYNLVTIGNPTSPEDLLKVKSLPAQKIRENILAGDVYGFVDVRSKIDYAADHIDGSINIPLEELEERKNELPLGKILVYDTEQIRSFRAAVRLYDMNVLTAYNCLDNYATLKQVLFTEPEPEQKPAEENKPAQ